MSLLSRVGIGTATVDLVVPERVEAGETVDARVDVSGGTDEQRVEAIYAALRTRYDAGGEREAVTVADYTLVDDFTIAAGEDRTFDVALDVPHGTPVTGSAEVWIDTGLDIEWAVDPDDTDPIEVVPGGRLQLLLDTVEDVGFNRLFGESIPAERTPLADAAGEFPLVQAFAFRPHGVGPGADLDDLAVLVHPGSDRLVARFVADRRDRDIVEWEADEGADATLEITGEPSPDDLDRRVRELVDRLA